MNKLAIDAFLEKLDKELSYRSKDKESYLNEVTDHLYSLIEEKKAKGLSEDRAITESINEFPSPETLAKDLIKNDTNTFIEFPTDEVDLKFRYKSALIVMGIGELSLLLVDQTLSYFLLLVGVLMLIIGNVMVLKHKVWKKDNIKQLLWVMIGTWTCLPLALFLFFRKENINEFLIFYIILLILIIIIQHFITFKIFKIKNHKL